MTRTLTSLLYGCLIFSNALFANDNDVVVHPAPKNPIYLDASLYESFKNKIPAPPTPQSLAQQNDESELFKLQASRSASDCAQAKEEVFVSLQSFFGAPRGFLNETDITLLSPFFEQVRNDGDYFIQKMKVDFPRQRPFAYINGLSPCIPKEVTGAYPSGHATLSKLYALILKEFFSGNGEQLETRAAEIGRHRVLSGMHHPTDIESGRKLAELIYVELRKSKKYRNEVRKLSRR
jgi:acid phosphatase (class A)